jgi:5-methyltetrahydropteroyltriglutamate--homocysteine methyltransferase
MLNFFWQKIPAFQGMTRPKPITQHDPDVFHPAATCHGPIAETIDLGLVDEFRMVSALTARPVKVTMSSPLILAKIAYDEHYGDIARMMTDLAKLLNHNLKLLAAAGCQHIQLDEPLFTICDEDEVDAAIDAINLAFDGLPRDIHLSVHVCQGNYAVGKEYDGQIGHRYFDHGRYKADKICRVECTSVLVEHDMTHHYEGLLGDKQIGIGAADVQDPKVESGELVAERIRAYRWLAPEQTIVTSSCGFNHLPRQTAFGKLKAMAEAKRVLGG